MPSLSRSPGDSFLTKRRVSWYKQTRNIIHERAETSDDQKKEFVDFKENDFEHNSFYDREERSIYSHSEGNIYI